MLEYFERIETKDSARCQLCLSVLACKASSTTGLNRHLEHVHGMKRKPTIDLAFGIKNPKKQNLIDYYIKRPGGQNI